ncbi:hypothetical protein IC229_04975 [Spirosoma sp. BT702]|uniref:Uncharacterized protein n=1 Tax=Spirosoma profusum TaxID=2771354 RepID=A0A926XUS0_9BACT|nr:hypothetical protein [Spirosoma profusum]MBD2699976.1 hypothetical protein [Spirosoma profusum]
MITHDLLLELGFESVPNRLQAYHYKGVIGWLNVEVGTFHFDGYATSIITQNDLRFLMWLIDY